MLLKHKIPQGILLFKKKILNASNIAREMVKRNIFKNYAGFCKFCAFALGKISANHAKSISLANWHLSITFGITV